MVDCPRCRQAGKVIVTDCYLCGGEQIPEALAVEFNLLVEAADAWAALTSELTELRGRHGLKPAFDDDRPEQVHCGEFGWVPQRS